MRKYLAGPCATILLLAAVAGACSSESTDAPTAPSAVDGGVAPGDAGTPSATDDAGARPSNPLVLDLGAVVRGVDVPFEIKAGALGFTIIVEGDVESFDQDRPFGIERITDPSGQVLHDDFTPKGGTAATSTVIFDTIASASVPQGQGVPTLLPTGTWNVRFGVRDNPTAKPKLRPKVRVQATDDGSFHGGTLDLTIHIPPGLLVEGKAVSAETAPKDKSIQDRINAFYNVTSALLGIERGTVSFRAAKASLAVLDDNEIADGFAVSAGETEGVQVLHVLFANAIRTEGKPVAVGLAPGIPGSAGLFGRRTSGIIVVPESNAEGDALTMLHEMGHFLGLNHTTELKGQSSDPLSDTAVCATITDQRLQTCPDRANVMFVAGPIAGPVALSASQRRVLRGSPVYKALLSGNAKLTPDQTEGLARTTTPSWSPKFRFRASGHALSAVESDLAAGFCGIQVPDAETFVRRHGGAAIAELRAAAADPDLSPFIRGRATLALARAAPVERRATELRP